MQLPAIDTNPLNKDYDMLKVAKKTLIGNPIAGITVNGNRVLASATLAAAVNFGVARPSVLTSDRAARAEGGSELVALAKLRRMVQRGFTKERKTNAQSYADYLISVRNGRQGGAPPINLYCSEPIVETEDGLFIPFGAQVFAIDGETQLEARFINGDRAPDTINDEIAFNIWHSIAPEHAAQIVHDFNTYANPISEKDMAARNIEGAMTQAVHAGLAASGVPLDQFNMLGGSLRKKAHVASFDQLLAAAAGVIDPVVASSHGGVGRVLAQHNYANADINPERVASVVAHLAQVAAQHPDVARATPPAVWTSLGVAATQGKVVNVADFTKANAAYDKAPRGGKVAAAVASLKSFMLGGR